MGVAYFIILDTPNIDAEVNGKAIAQAAHHLNRLAQSLGLRSLDEFVSLDDEAADFLAEEFGVEADTAIADPQWFTPAEGLAWIAAVRDYLQQSPTAVLRPADVLTDLSEYEQVLQAAKAVNARWRLSIDI